MPDKKRDAVRGEVGHFLYRKDMAKGLKFDKKGIMISQGPPEEGMTDSDTPGFKGTDIKKHDGTPDPDGDYTKEVAKGFNKREQKNLLKARGIKYLARDSEAVLVKKIVDSNPDEEEEDNEPEEPDAPEAEGTAEHLYTKEELEDFKAKKLVEILKGLGDNRIPMSEKGRIDKILKLQK